MRRRVGILAATACLVIAIGGAVQFAPGLPIAALTGAASADRVATATPLVESSAEPSPPGGLGNLRADLEDRYGPPTGLQGTMIAYQNGRYAVTYSDGRATAILVNFPTAPSSLAEARAAVRGLLPSDSVLVGTLGAGPSRVADAYRSTRLGAKVAPSASSVPPGQFVVIYETNQAGAVKDALLAVGQVPSS